MSDTQVNWDSSFAKYILVLGVVLFGAGAAPVTKRGYETWYTDIVRQGGSMVFGLSPVQLFLILSGVSLAGYSIYLERTST
jgi:hypothetical protein